MTRNRSIRTMAAVLALAGLTAPAHAQQPTSEARIREVIRQAADAAAGQAGASAPAPGQTMPTEPARPVIPMTLELAVKLALERNLDISVQRLNPEINNYNYAGIRSAYHPSLTSQLFDQSFTNPSTSTIGGGSAAGSAVVVGTATYNGGIAQNLPWGGGNFSVALNNNRQTTTSLNSLFNPSYNTSWSGSFTQPLARNFKTDLTRQQLQVAKLTTDISDVQLRATITNTLSNVRNAYWDYVYAIQAVEAAQQSLDLAAKLVQDNQTRVDIGTMAPIDVVQAQSEAATRRQTLVAARSTQRTTELALKRLVASGTEDPNWNVTINPTDRPDFAPEPIDIEKAVRRALNERTDLAIAKANARQNDITIKYLGNQSLPQVDLVAFYGLTGLGGTQLITSGSGVNQTVTGTIPGGYAEALSSMGHVRYPRWTVTMNFSYPLGLSAAQASVARARVQLSQVQAQVKQMELQVATDVTNAALTAQSNAEGVQAAQAARALSQRKLEAEQSKFEVGMSTNYFVVQAQRDLADAQNSELRAVLNYRKSLVELDRLQQTTLQSLNVTIVSR